MTTRLFVLLLLTGVFASCTRDHSESTVPVKSLSSMHKMPPSVPAYDGMRALSLIEQQVAFGPRVPGTQAHTHCLEFIRDLLSSTGASVEVQSFTFPGYKNETLNLSNVIARINPGASPRIMLSAHWDSRPYADRETDPDRAALGVPGANDGASGTAVLLHLAEVLGAHPPPVGVDVVLFDGEDYGNEGDAGMYCIGSKYFAVGLDAATAPIFGILLDMVGDRDAEFPREEFSQTYAKDVVDLVWGTAAALGLKEFTPKRAPAILDDHVQLNTVAGVKTINIIDADLVGHATSSPRRKYWHTLDDLPRQCSAETLEHVGSLLLHIIYGFETV